MSLQKCFFRVQSSNPVLPPETWTLVQEIAVAGAYNTTIGWGKYKIVISGGGGAGGASASDHATSRNWANNGSAGEELTIMVTVPNGENKTISGIIASGAQPSYAYADKPNRPSATRGTAGTGYANGGLGGQATYYDDREPALTSDTSAAAGGSGGGSTSLEIDGVLNSVARGGNGGACRADQVAAQSGGVGGSGGVGSGTGAAGGTGRYTRTGGGYSGAGENGYVRVYKSNLYPEPV